MKNLICSVALVVALGASSIANAQTPNATPKAAKSEATNLKIRKVDALIQILPLNLKKAQIDMLLVQYEKGQESERTIRMLEDDELEKLDPKLSEVLKSALEKGVYPPREFQGQVAALTRAMSIRRQVAVGEIIDAYYKAFTGVIEPGQITIMAKSLNPALLSPGIKVDQMTDEAKVKFFIRAVFLDPAAYEVLKELRKTAV